MKPILIVLKWIGYALLGWCCLATYLDSIQGASLGHPFENAVLPAVFSSVLFILMTREIVTSRMKTANKATAVGILLVATVAVNAHVIAVAITGDYHRSRRYIRPTGTPKVGCVVRVVTPHTGGNVFPCGRNLQIIRLVA